MDAIYGGMRLKVNICMSITEVTIKYFEKGHTFMSCDSFHHSVEQGMRVAKNIYDLGNCEVLEQFTDFPNGSNQSKSKPKLRDVKVIQFRRSETYFLERKIQPNRFLFDAILESENNEDNQR